jgi:hypothetical protein
MKIQRHRLFDFLDFVLSLESSDSLEQLLIYQDLATSTEKALIAAQVTTLGKFVVELLASPQKINRFWLFFKERKNELYLIEADYCYADGPAWVEISESKLLSVFNEAKALIGTQDYLQNCLIYYREVFFGKTIVQ